MMQKATILVIDDEIQIRRLLKITLQAAGYFFEEAETAQTGIIKAAMHPPDMILLDIGLPDEDGFSVLQKLRDWYLQPVVILSIHSAEDEIIKALDLGANDYLIKPFRTGELLARIRNALRTTHNNQSQQVFEFGNLEINLDKRLVKLNGETVRLTHTEYNLLILLIKNQGRVLTHQFILKEIWGPGYVEQSQYLRVFIGQLRKKIEEKPDNPRLIVTESRIGYRFIGTE